MSDSDDEEKNDDNGNAFKKFLQCDLVRVRVEGDDPDRVSEEFDDAVETAFDKYEEYVAGSNGGGGMQR